MAPWCRRSPCRGGRWRRSSQIGCPTILFQNPKNLSQASIPNKHSEFDVPIHSGLTLWLEASQLVERDPQGRVSCWGDIGIGDNTVSDNAWQVDMRHRPALDSKSCCRQICYPLRWHKLSCYQTIFFERGPLSHLCFSGTTRRVSSAKDGALDMFFRHFPFDYSNRVATTGSWLPLALRG